MTFYHPSTDVLKTYDLNDAQTGRRYAEIRVLDLTHGVYGIHTLRYAVNGFAFSEALLRISDLSKLETRAKEARAYEEKAYQTRKKKWVNQSDDTPTQGGLSVGQHADSK